MSGFFLGVVLVATTARLLPAAWIPLLALPACAMLSGWGRPLLVGMLLAVAWATASGSRVQAQWLPSDCERVPVTLEGRIASVPERGRAFGDKPVQRFLLDVTAMAPARCTGPLRVRLSYYGDVDLFPGANAEVRARLRVPWGLANPGGSDREGWYATNRVHAVGSVSRIILADSAPSWRYRHQVARARLQQSITSLQGSARSKGLLAALTVGARDQIAHDDWALFKELGVVHLAVISGLHVSLASGAGAIFGQLLMRILLLLPLRLHWPSLPGILALASAALYAALAGFSLPTVRALVMLAGVIVALSLGRTALRVHTLLLAVLLLLLMQPLAVVSSSFWLSVGAVCALLWFVAWQPQQQPLTAGFRVHLYLCVAMLPLTAWWFGGGSLIAPLANAVAVPVVGALVVPLTLLASLVNAVSLTLSDHLWRLALLLLEILLSLADGLAAYSPALRYRPLAGGAYAAVNALFAVALLAVPMPMTLKIATACLLLPLLLRQTVPAPESGAELVVLDVGQGTSVVVSDGQHTLVYDTGSGQPGGYTAASAALIPFLQQRGIHAVDTLVISHIDNDHSGGTQALMDAMPVGELLYGQRMPAVERGRPCRTGSAWAWDSGVSFQILAGADAGGLSANDSSCVLRVNLAGVGFLLPGDISETRERELVLYWRDAVQSDWLLAAHHGSGGSTGAPWLRAVKPTGVVLNHGRANAFGHPHSDVITRLATRGIDIRSTARSGALLFRVDSRGKLHVSGFRDRHRQFWRPPA